LNRCFACGGPIEDTLLRLGSPRCQDCRCARRPLDRALAGDLYSSTNGNGHVPVSVTVRITDPSRTVELLEFLRRRACEAELLRGDLVVVRPHPTLRPAHVRAELEILLAVWQQERPDARAFLVA
jgi:hypothetical protein